jgi:nitroimidazol reductase NimA-like FMN-containing flavoprotein (pyridoxamine 5'-phosphate oxidase superfamily)
MNLVTFLGKQVLGVLAAYLDNDVVIHICGVYPQWDNRLRLFFPHGHSLSVGDLATIHLDNRSGVDEFDSSIRVYRTSYKGRIISVEEDWVMLEPRECVLLHGFTAQLDIREPGYAFPADPRPESPVPFTPLDTLPSVEDKDRPNKVGVLVTMAEEQPHTTVLAFLSTEEDDIFLITFPETFKSKQLKRNTHCFFVMDERASFTFERSIEWNYTIVEGEATIVAHDTPLFTEVQQAFVDKNPWEMPFFIRPDVEMYHIRKIQLLCPGVRKPR